MGRALGIAGTLLVGAVVILSSACSGGAQTSTPIASQEFLTATPNSASSPVPAALGPPYLSLASFQFVDPQTGWITATTCRDVIVTPPGPPAFGKGDSQEQPTATTVPGSGCRPTAFYGTADGETWQLLSHEGIDSFVMDSSGVGFALAAAGSDCQSNQCTTKVLRSIDGGKNWTEVYNRDSHLSNLSLVDGEAWVVATSSCGENGTDCSRSLVLSNDGGGTWASRQIPVSGYYVSLSRPAKEDAWITSSSGQGAAIELQVTHDSGATWTALSTLDVHAFQSEIVFRPDGHGWLLAGGQPYSFAAQDKALYGTIDGGATWAQLFDTPGDIPGNVGQLQLSLVSDEDGWAAAAHVPRGLEHTTDGGRTWTSMSVDNDYGGQDNALEFIDAEHGWTVSDYYDEGANLELKSILWTTSDGGATWKKVPLPLPEKP